MLLLATINSKLLRDIHATVKPSLLFHSVVQSQLKTTNLERQEKPSTIVILHGLLGSTRNFRSFARLLSNQLKDEYDIVVVDLRNHGRSSLIGPLRMDYTSMALDLYETLDHLKIKKCHIIGHSMGGKVAAMASLIHKKLKSSNIHQQIDIQSLCMLDICPVEYSAQDFSSVYDTVDFLIKSQPEIEKAKSRNEVINIINSNISDPSLRAFLLTNIQENKIKTTTEAGTTTVSRFTWKLHVSEIDQSKHLIANFPKLDTNIYNYDKPTLIIKGANSTNFVRSIYLDKIKPFFPNFMITTQRNAGHWLHADQPDQTADKIIQFIKYAENLS